MKKQDVLVFIAALIMMISCAALSFGQLLDIDESNLQEYRNEYEKVLDIGFMGEDIRSFAPALQKGNLRAVKYLSEAYPGLNLLTTPIVSKDGTEDSPICIAAAAGHNNIIEYILGKYPELINKRCRGQGENRPITKAVDNGHANTAEYLLLKNATPTEDLFIRTAKFAKEEAQLKTFIPELLNAKVKPSYQVGEYLSDRMDAFYFAAMEENEAFVVTLRDELQKQGKEAVSYYTYVTCPDYHSEAWGISKEWLREDRKRNIQRIKDSNESKFLEKYGVEVEIDVDIVDSIDCE